MENDLLEADFRELYEPVAERLEEYGASHTFEWLSDLLEQQRPALRSSNSKFVAYTGCPEAIDWLERHVSSPVTTHWGEAAALLGTPWDRIKEWLGSDRHHQLMALDTLYAFRLPAPNMAPIEQIAAPTLVNPPSREEFEAVLQAIMEAGGNPRMRQTIERIMVHLSEILTPRERRVAVSDLPHLFLEPDSFANSTEILDNHEKVISGIKQTIKDILSV
ncbi:hypothetical protein [Photobacterium swingsii]|uniref:hypothetical protein n=1 Tax=Photobacterium swingsii TaxID=680026 RepID=UPI0040684BAE